MIRVSPSEYALLTLARAVMGPGHYAPVEDLLRDRHAHPARLSPGAARALRDTLSKGTLLSLARTGGWRRRFHLSTPEGRTGRLWERHAPPPLRFSALCFHTLRWLLEQPLAVHGHLPLDVDAEPTTADELFLYRVCRLVMGTACAQGVGAQPQFQRSALCRLGFPDLFTEAPVRPTPASFAPLLAQGGWLLEALQDDLALRWRAVEEAKPAVGDPEKLVALGHAQEHVLGAFLGAAEAARRRDLAGFLLDALRPLLARPASRWVAGLALSRASLSSRAEASRAAGAGLRALGRLAAWDAEHRAVRFFDDDYDVAQRLLSEWSSMGEAGFRLAAERERELATSLSPSEPIPDTLPPPSSESAP
ncbi:hypothetical protein LZ198_25975 [Myxococcus sp. K15C18031901]|uniref:hypothetical protein n=1 Tax=Myxococcus dinghuensis TaxID=2906761 RepID=UPI0020A7CAA8|nr:hypothetical protein [Myxococcus dinghuensis]MCP3102324.1 hypothetical protein [Myxococcus dinghuensis]